GGAGGVRACSGWGFSGGRGSCRASCSAGARLGRSFALPLQEQTLKAPPDASGSASPEQPARQVEVSHGLPLRPDRIGLLQSLQARSLAEDWPPSACARSQKRTAPSMPPVTTSRPSLEKATDWTPRPAARRAARFRVLPPSRAALVPSALA